jgi:high affinity sulfate transporter 1
MSSIKTIDQEQKPLIIRFVPILTWLPRYRREWVRFDILAGITVWGTTVPTAMGYAQVAGLPIQAGLYAAMVALVAYAIFGSSSLLKVETSPSMAIMSAAVIAPLALGNLPYYITLSAALALIVGLLLFAAGLARMGFLSDFLAKPVVTGFLFGLALIIIIGQLPSLFGLKSGEGTGLMQLGELITSLDDTSLITLAISAISFLLLFVFKRYIPRFPRALMVLGFSILVVLAFNLEELGVAIVGRIPTGLPSAQIPIVRINDIPNLLLGATAMVFVSLGESLGTARSFAAEHRKRTDTNQELLALGVANLGAGLFQGFSVGVNPATTSAIGSTRARTQLASIITAALLAITLVTRPDIIGFLPQAVVAVAVIVTASHLLKMKELRRFYHLRKIDFTLAIVALLGVFVTGVLVGLLIAVFLSLLIVLYRSSQPHISVLGKIPGHIAYGDIEENPDAEQIPGVLIVRPDVPLFFANVNTMNQEIRSLISAAKNPVEMVLIDLGASEDLDIASIDMLSNLIEELEDENITLLLADVEGATRSRMEHTGLVDKIGEKNIYLRVPEAVEAQAKSIIQ